MDISLFLGVHPNDFALIMVDLNLPELLLDLATKYWTGLVITVRPNDDDRAVRADATRCDAKRCSSRR